MASMRSLLPWISYSRQDRTILDSNSTNVTPKLTLLTQQTKPFQLKHLNKHVSEYQRSEDTPLQQMRETVSSAGQCYRKKQKVIRNKKEEIMEKAKEVNNKYYLSLMTKIEQKKTLMNCLSLKRFQSSQKQNSLQLFMDTKIKMKEKKVPPLLTHNKSASSVALKDNMRSFKVSLQFRSKWFTDLQNIKEKQ